MDEGPTPARTHTCSYTISFKLDVLKKLSELHGNISATARFFCIPRSCVQDWLRQQDKLEACRTDDDLVIRKRRCIPSSEDTAKKRARCPAMEESLASWISEERKQGIPVSASHIKARAEDLLSKSDGATNFKASNGWLERFTKRYKVVNRSVTSVGQKVPDNARELCHCFFKFHESVIGGIELKNIGNMDETPMYFDLPQNKTYDFKGVKHVTGQPARTSFDTLLFSAQWPMVQN